MRAYLLIFTLLPLILCAKVKVGADLFFEEGHYRHILSGKQVGLISNQSAVSGNCETTLERLLAHKSHYKLQAVFAPEHGYFGHVHVDKPTDDHQIAGIPIHNLDGQTRRPTDQMLKNIQVLVYDIQDIGSRSYTFISTLFYCMEEAAERGITFVVLDRPNPLGGKIVDGPLVDPKCRSFLSYINIPYCHGMTVGELARFFNEEYHIGCKLVVIPMQGWRRCMTFTDTRLVWAPTSPQIPEANTAFFYPTTGLIGHCSLVNIGIGYTLPFKVIGAPWMDGEAMAKALNKQKLPGISFRPFVYRPFFGKFKQEECQGVRLVITNPRKYLPVTTQYTMMGVIKNLYPKQFAQALSEMEKSKSKTELFHKLNGTTAVFETLKNERYIIWKLRALCQEGKETFLPIRKKYLLYK